MKAPKINVSGASGSGTSVKIYETPDYEDSWRGACVMHGSFTARPTAPDNQRIEVVELHMVGIDIRVKADDVRTELHELHGARREAAPSDNLGACHRAFESLRTAVFGLGGKHLTAQQLEAIVHAAFDNGVRRGEQLVREKFRSLLGL